MDFRKIKNKIKNGNTNYEYLTTIIGEGGYSLPVLHAFKDPNEGDKFQLGHKVYVDDNIRPWKREPEFYAVLGFKSDTMLEFDIYARELKSEAIIDEDSKKTCMSLGHLVTLMLNKGYNVHSTKRIVKSDS